LDIIEKDKFLLRNPDIRGELLGINPNDFTMDNISHNRYANFEFEDDLTKILDDINLNSFSGISEKYQSHEKDAVPANLLIFEDGEFGFFTKKYKAKVLNNIKETLEIKTLEELEIDDEIIFLSNSRKDIFDEFIEISERNPSYCAEVKTSKIWKNAIKKYMECSGNNAQVFARELVRHGCKRHLVTVKNWIEGKHIIGPGKERETLKSIVEVTNDSDLKNNLKEVVFACRKLRALHIRMGRYLAQCIFASIDSQQERKIDGVMRNRIKELSECIITAQVKAVDKNYKKVARNKVNCLLEIGE